jgi:hypothetical protein
LPDIEQIKEVSVAGIDERAKQELQDFISENNRTNREKNTKHWAFVFLMWVGTVAVALVLFAKVYHLLCAHNYAWLDKDQLNKIDEFLTSGIIGGSVVGFFKSKISDPNKM